MARAGRAVPGAQHDRDRQHDPDRRDPELGPHVQYSLHKRNYDPETARFTSADPAEDDRNFYRKASNDPINREDPSGCAEKDSVPDVADVKPTDELSSALYWARQYIKTAQKIGSIEASMAVMFRNNHRISRKSYAIQSMEQQVRALNVDLDSYAEKLSVDFAGFKHGPCIQARPVGTQDSATWEIEFAYDGETGRS